MTRWPRPRPLTVTLGALALCSIALASEPRAQKTWYVSAAACPGPGSGEQDDPFCRIRNALEAAEPGDTILVGAGTYAGQLDLVSGVDLVGAGAGRSILTGTGEDVDVVRMVSLSDVRLAGFSITGASAAGSSQGAGVFVNQPDGSLVIEDCEIFGNSEGIVVFNAFMLSGPDILDNDIHDNDFYGIDCPGAGFVIGNRIYRNGAGGVYQGPENVTPRFLNNTIWGNFGDGVYYENDARSVFRDNIIAANQGFGIHEVFSGGFLIAHPQLTRNVFFQNGLGNYRMAQPNATLNSAAEINTVPMAVNNMVFDPLLCRPPANFHVCILSPVLGAGTQGADIGALGAGCGAFASGASAFAAGCPSGPLPRAPRPVPR